MNSEVPVIKYFNIKNGRILLRRTETATTLQFEILNSTGEWQHGTETGASVLSGNEIDFDEINLTDAAVLAAKLGGRL